MIDKLTAARRQIECAIRLVAAMEDELAVHTLVMAAMGVLKDLSKDRPYYELGIKPELTAMGIERFNAIANFLKHADRDPNGVLEPFTYEENDWRVGFCLLLYRDLAGKFTPEMAAFHNWMVIRYPDHFMLAEDEDQEFERVYREGNKLIHDGPRDVKLILLKVLLDIYKSGTIRADIGYRRRPHHT
jgi:hypothetical protein